MSNKKLAVKTLLFTVVAGGITAIAVNLKERQKRKQRENEVDSIEFPKTILIHSDEIEHAELFMEQLVAKLTFSDNNNDIRTHYIVGDDECILLGNVHYELSEYNGEKIIVIKNLENVTADELLSAMQGLEEYNQCSHIIIVTDDNISNKLEDKEKANTIFSSLSYEIYERYIRESNKYEYSAIDNVNGVPNIILEGTEQVLEWIGGKE